MKGLCYYLPFILLLSQCRPKEDSAVTQFAGKPQVPSSIQKEHAELRGQLHAFTLLNDSTGLAAKKLEELLQHHFKEEEDYVLPPLGLLPLLASGKIPVHSEEVIVLTDKLKAQLAHMGAEHQLIKAFMADLKRLAILENHPGIIEFEEKLHRHACTEEEINFPAAIMVGEYLKIKTPR